MERLTRAGISMKPWAPMAHERKVRPEGLTLYPVERLGNQLFTYAAVFAQARRLSVPCYVNKAFFAHARPERSFQCEYELDVFDNGLLVPPERSYHLPVFLGFPASAAPWWHNRVQRFLPENAGNVFRERSSTYDARLRDVRPGTTVLGFFQSWRYFDDCATEIRARMTRLAKPSDWYLEMCEKIQPGAGNVGLHVRRGDYMLPENVKYHGLAGRAYYQRALAHLRKLGVDGPVYLATDSPESVRKEFDGMGEFLLIDPPPGCHPFEVVLLLSRVDGLVTANSSFSWWAGFIGERPGQVVIAPRPWFTKSSIDTRDLLPPDWLSMSREGSGLLRLARYGDLGAGQVAAGGAGDQDISGPMVTVASR